MVDSIAVRGWAVPFLDSNGDPIGDGTVEFYDAGTSDARTVYSTKDLSTTSLGTTVDLNAAGILVNDSNALVNVYTGTTDYKVIIKDSASATVYTIDNIKGAIDTSALGGGSGSFSGSVVSETSDFTVDSTYDTKVVHANPTGGEFTATFDDATTLGDGFVCGFRHDGTANQLRFATVAGQTIDVPGANAASGYALRSMGHFVTISCDGANFLVTVETLPLGEQSPITIVDILSSPPSSPTAGAIYMLGASPSGDWSSFSEHDLSQADGQGGWIKYTPPTDCGWEAYVQDGNVKYRFEASAWVLLDDKPPTASTLGRMVVRHTETTGTTAAAGTATTWTTRKLDDEAVNGITDASLSSNQITLPTGVYLVDAWQTFDSTGDAATRFQSTTDSAKLIQGGNASFVNGNAVGGILPTVGIITVTAASETFELQYHVDVASSGALGKAQNISGTTEVYAAVSILDLSAQQGPSGDQGTQGATGPGYTATSTTSLAIGTGSKAFTTQSGLAYTAGARVKAASDADTDNWMAGIVASYSGTTLTVTVDETNGSGTLADWNINLAGETGATGSTGSTGSNGQVLIDYTFDSASQADSDPGSGMIRANNATPASVTAFYIDDLDRLGVDQSTAIDAFDASTSSGTKSTMYAEDLTSGDRWTFDITAVSDSSGYWEITASHVAGTASFASNNWAITVIPRGDKGADGAGSGDVVGPASAVDNEIVLFDSTTGKLVKSATTTGLVKATSGVIAAAVSGTDYLAPPSGTSVLKANSGGALANAVATDLGAGDHMIPILASQMIPRTTNGAAEGTSELATNDIMLQTLDFDTTTEEGAGFWFPMPESWDEGTVTFQPIWTAGSGSGGVVWGLAAYAFSDNDALDTAVSGQQTSTDTFITANDCHIGPESSAITIGGTPAAGDLVYFEVTREVADGSDTLAVDALLIGLRLFITTDALND